MSILFVVSTYATRERPEKFTIAPKRDRGSVPKPHASKMFSVHDMS